MPTNTKLAHHESNRHQTADSMNNTQIARSADKTLMVSDKMFV